MQYEILENLPFHDYCEIDAVNQSSLKLLYAESPAHYREAITIPNDKETDAQLLGSLLHVATFEPIELLRFYTVMPDYSTYPEVLESRTQKGDPYKNPRVSPVYKSLVAEFEAANTDKTVVNQHQYDTVVGMAASLRQSERAREYLGEGDAEVVVLWTDPETGIHCKARFDKWCKSRRRVTDLKTSENVRKFNNAIAKWHYDFQAAWYTTAAELITGEPHEFCVVAIEKTRPYGVRSAPIGDDTLASGRRKIRKSLNTLADCRDSGEWPCYEDPKQWHAPAYHLLDEEPIELSVGGTAVTV